MEALLRNIFLKYDSLNAAEKKKLIEDINGVLGTVQPKKTTAKGKYETVTQLVEKEDMAIYEKLRQWRNKVARDLDLQPWLVFNNATLTNIAFYKPKTLEDLMKVNGVGAEKSGKYCEAIIEIIGSKTSPKVENIPEEIEVFEQPVIKRRLQSNK